MANQAQTVLRNLNVQTTYKLKYPVELADGTKLTELDVRRPKGKDLRLFEEKGFDTEKDGVKILRFYIQQLTTLVPEDIDELDAVDLLAQGLVPLQYEFTPKIPAERIRNKSVVTRKYLVNLTSRGGQ